jgi:hypothetical protein
MTAASSLSFPSLVVPMTSQSGKPMRKETCSATQLCGFDPAKLRDFLRAKYPHDTAKAVAAVLGLKSPRTVENWLVGRSAPDFEGVGRLVDAFGPEFIVAVSVKRREWADAALALLELADIERRQSAIKERLQGAGF